MLTLSNSKTTASYSKDLSESSLKLMFWHVKILRTCEWGFLVQLIVSLFQVASMPNKNCIFSMDSRVSPLVSGWRLEIAGQAVVLYQVFSRPARKTQRGGMGSLCQTKTHGKATQRMQLKRKTSEHHIMEFQPRRSQIIVANRCFRLLHEMYT